MSKIIKDSVFEFDVNDKIYRFEIVHNLSELAIRKCFEKWVQITPDFTEESFCGFTNAVVISALGDKSDLFAYPKKLYDGFEEKETELANGFKPLSKEDLEKLFVVSSN